MKPHMIYEEITILVSFRDIDSCEIVKNNLKAFH